MQRFCFRSVARLPAPHFIICYWCKFIFLINSCSPLRPFASLSCICVTDLTRLPKTLCKRFSLSHQHPGPTYYVAILFAFNTLQRPYFWNLFTRSNACDCAPLPLYISFLRTRSFIFPRCFALWPPDKEEAFRLFSQLLNSFLSFFLFTSHFLFLVFLKHLSRWCIVPPCRPFCPTLAIFFTVWASRFPFTCVFTRGVITSFFSVLLFLTYNAFSSVVVCLPSLCLDHLILN